MSLGQISQLTYLWTDVTCKYLETTTLIRVSGADPNPLDIVQDAVFCYTVAEISLRLTPSNNYQ